MFPTEDTKFIWRPDTLRNIIRNRVYCGDCVMGKTDTIFKTKKHRRTDKSNWVIVEDTHEPLVSRDVWMRANELSNVRKHMVEVNSRGERNPFAGLLKCADCSMSLTRRKYGGNSNHMIYVCTTYATYGSGKCSQHKLFEEDLKTALYEDMRSMLSIAVKDEDLLIEHLVRAQAKVRGKQTSLREKEYKQICSRLDDLTRLIDGLFEAYALKTMSTENYERLMRKYQEEQKELNTKKKSLELSREEVKDMMVDAQKFTNLLLQCDMNDLLNPDFLKMIIDHIAVHEPQRVNGVLRQQLDIYYRFIGTLETLDYKSMSFRKNRRV